MKKATISLVLIGAILMTVSALWFTSRSVTPKDATWDTVVTEAEVGGYKLITTQELAEIYKDKNSDRLIVDTRQNWEYRAGHIKGAVNFPIEPTAWSRWKNKGDLETLLGPDTERLIVFY